MYEIIFQFYGIDWFASVATAISIYLLGSKKPSGFVWGILANIAWIILNIWVQVIAAVVLNAILLIFNLRGFMYWQGDEQGERARRS